MVWFLLLTRLPRIWLIAALSFRVHSATTLALISFIYSMKAFRGFLIWGFLSSSFLAGTGDFLLIRKKKHSKDAVGNVWATDRRRRILQEERHVLTAPSICPYACIVGLMLSLLGSCLMAGETMAGWGMPVWWRLCGGGVTMWGEKRLDTKLWGQKQATF